MKVLRTSINGVLVVKAPPYKDERGAFARLFCAQELSAFIEQRKILQINHSLTFDLGAVRGLHFQYPPYAEMKLVRCLKGRVWDVAVDLRANSQTFLKWHAEELSPANNRIMIIPEGCAHGFQVMEPESELLYMHTAFYMPNSEGGVRYDDPEISITWPISITELSERDAHLPLIRSNFRGVSL